MKVLDSKSKISTKVIKTAKLDKKTIVTIEKIIEGKNKDQYVVKSYSKKIFFGYRESDLAAYNIDTDFYGDAIVKIEYPMFTFVKQAAEYLAYVKSNKYKR